MPAFFAKGSTLHVFLNSEELAWHVVENPLDEKGTLPLELPMLLVYSIVTIQDVWNVKVYALDSEMVLFPDWIQRWVRGDNDWQAFAAHASMMWDSSPEDDSAWEAYKTETELRASTSVPFFEDAKYSR